MRRFRLIAMACMAAAGLLILSGNGRAGSRTPSLRLLSPIGHVSAYRFPGDPNLFVSPAIYAAATNGPFELQWAARGRWAGVWRIQRDQNGPHRIGRLITPGHVSMTDGLPAFFHAVLDDASGTTVLQADLPFCPNGSYSLARVNASGPNQPAYPYYCGGSLTRAMVWGIDAGWASSPSLSINANGIADGQYTLRLSINDIYAKQLEVPVGSGTVTIYLNVKTMASPPPGVKALALSTLRSQRNARAGEGPRQVSPMESRGNTGTGPGGGLPDMAALPAHDLSIEHNTQDGHDYLDFAATIWNAGAGPLIVEGFRRGSAPRMTATQFIYENGKPVRSKQIGSFEFDRRPGHHHWHMEDIAQYDMLDATGTRVVLSEKQSFCLAPTDAIDLTKSGADWQPDRTGLSSSCAGEESIWLREALPAGWGDTYYQSVAGQSFDITNLANGHYQVRITTNPDHRILEPSYSNNSALLPVTLGGTPGSRTVTRGWS